MNLENSITQYQSSLPDVATVEQLDTIVHALADESNRNAFTLATVLKAAHVKGLAKESGYKNIAELAKERYGMAKATAYVYINMTEYLHDNVSTHWKTSDGKDFSVAQITVLTQKKVNPEEVKSEWMDLTVKQLRDIIDRKANAIDGEAVDNSVEDTTSEETSTLDLRRVSLIVETDLTKNFLESYVKTMKKFKINEQVFYITDDGEVYTK